MLKKVSEFLSLKQRRLRRIEEIKKASDNEENIRALLSKIKPKMYIDFKKLEDELVEKGEVERGSMYISLDKDNPIFKSLAALSIREDEKSLDFRDLAYVSIDRDTFGTIRIVAVSASCEYMGKEIEPELNKRGINISCVSKAKYWYLAKFSIEGL